MELNSIGYFQFNNLIESRTPFALLSFEDVDLSHWYQHVHKMHYQNILIFCEEPTYLENFKSKNYPLDFSIVVIDRYGTISPKVVTALEGLGYINCYFVTGGAQGIEAEKQGQR